MQDLAEQIRKHWAHRGDLDRIESQLRRRGCDVQHLSVEELAVLDQLHSGALAATKLFVSWVGIGAGDRVLDLGAGLGGPARYLARELGCRVTAVELAPELVEAGRALTRRLALDELVDHHTGDALSWGGGDGPFDVVLLQHVDMHVPDKVALYHRCRAHLTTSGRVVWHDWLAGPGGDMLRPVPWAREGEGISFLSSRAAFESNLAAAGLELRRYRELMPETGAWFTSSRDRLRRVLAKDDVAGRRGLESILAEAEGVLANLEAKRLVPFLGEAR